MRCGPDGAAYLCGMLVKTRGLVLRNLRYGDTSLIVDIYSRELGLQSYIVNGARKPGARMSAGLFQVMTLLDLVVYHQEKASLKRIREVAPAIHYQHLQREIRPNAVGLFLLEVLRNALPHTEPHPELFDFVEGVFTGLDAPPPSLARYLLESLVQLTGHLGIRPGGRYSAEEPFFDLLEGGFVSDPPPHPHYLLPPTTQALSALLTGEVPEGASPDNDRTRQALLQGLLDYLRLHLDHFREPRSREILRELLAI